MKYLVQMHIKFAKFSSNNAIYFYIITPKKKKKIDFLVNFI